MWSYAARRSGGFRVAGNPRAHSSQSSFEALRKKASKRTFHSSLSSAELHSSGLGRKARSLPTLLAAGSKKASKKASKKGSKKGSKRGSKKGSQKGSVKTSCSRLQKKAAEGQCSKKGSKKARGGF